MTLTPDLPQRFRQSRGDMLSGMTPASLAAVLRAHDQGHIRAGQLLFSQVEARDLDILAAAPKRRASVAARPWDIVVRADIDDSEQAEASLHREALLHAYNNIAVRDALDLDLDGEVRMLVEQQANAVFSGYAMHEIAWRPQGADLTATLTHCHAALFETTRGGLAFAGPEATTGKALLTRDEWIVTRGYGLSYGLSIAWLLSSICLRDQLAFLSRYGLPGVLGTTSAKKGSTEHADFSNAVGEFGNLWAAVVGEGNKIELIEASATGGDQWATLREEIKRSKTAICMGSDLSTISRKDGAGASLQADDNDRLVTNDLLLVSETLNRRFDRLAIKYVFGDGVQPLAYFKLTPPEQDDTKDVMERAKFLREMGVPIGIKELAESVGHSLPAKGVATVEVERLANAAAPLLPAADAVPELAPVEAASAAVADDLAAVLARLVAAAADDADTLDALSALDVALPAMADAVLDGTALEQVLAGHAGEAFLRGLGLDNIIAEVLGSTAQPAPSPLP